MKKSGLGVVLACFAFALVVGLVGCGGSGTSTSSPSSSGDASNSSASSSSEGSGEAEYNRAVDLFNEGKYYSAKAAFEKSEYGDWEKRAAACVQPLPESGELYHDANMTSDKMKLIFTVNDESADKGMYISVFTKDNKLVETVFVKGSGSVETGLPGGEYYIKDSAGTEWYGEDEQFGPDGHYETMVFNEVENDRYLTVLEEGFQYAITINGTTGVGQGVDSEAGGWEDRA